MDTLEAIRTRRAVKHYDPEFVIPEEDEKLLKEALRHSPTSFNLQNWRFVTVRDKDLRAQIREAGMNQAHITDCSLLYIFCADVQAWNKEPERTWSNAPEDVRNIYAPMIKGFYEGRDWQQRDEAIRSIGIASQTLMLAATALGYQTCPMIGFDSDKVGELINLPDDHIVGMMVTVGKGTQAAWEKPGWLSEDEVFIEDRF